MSKPVFTREGYVDHSEPCARTQITDAWGNTHDYALYPVKAGKAFNQLEWFTAVLGSSVEIVSSVFSSGKSTAAAFDALAKVVWTKGGVDKVVELLSSTQRGERRIINAQEFDRAYTMNLAEMFRALAWTLREQYSDFFPDASPSNGQSEESTSEIRDLLMTVGLGLLNKHGLLDAARSLTQSTDSTSSTDSARSSTG